MTKVGRIHGKMIRKMSRLIQCQFRDRTCDIQVDINNNAIATIYFRTTGNRLASMKRQLLIDSKLLPVL